ncbi:MAG TPA: hypothetical protein VEJ39_08570 [Candidatus Acidoferrales bacterium]|nr:hypothetical protein [Candidatus Acidoferrales bacterium]
MSSLAAKIAANIEKANATSLAVTNMSSLSPAAVAQTRAALEEALQQRGFELSSSNSRGPAVEVTLSENLEEYVWTARIRQGDAQRIVIISFPHITSPPGATPEPTIFLQRQFIWGQSERVLDFGIIPGTAPDGGVLVILEADQLVFVRDVRSEISVGRGVAIPHSKPAPRDVRGRINMSDQTAELPGVKCTGKFEHNETVQCQEVAEDKETDSRLAGMTVVINGRSVEAARLTAACRQLILVSGGGDWSEPDTIRAYTEADHQLTPLGNILEFPGPVLAIWPAKDEPSARVTSRNLQTGAYETSIVSVACNP